MMLALKPGFDRLLRAAPLGLQCRDTLDGRVVADGLQVELIDTLQPERRRRLAANASGVFVAHAAPGLGGPRGFGELDEQPASDPGRYLLRVQDPRGRYLATELALGLPVAGMLQPALNLASPPRLPTPWLPAGQALPAYVPLFSAPTRPLPAGVGVVRADLRRAAWPDQPLPWARVELWLDGELRAVGVSDAGGGLLLPLPLPRPRESLAAGSPPARLEALEWTVTLTACWHPERLAELADGRPAAELHAVHQQPEITLYEAFTLTPGGPVGLPLFPQTLSAAAPLLLHSEASSFLFAAA